MRTTQYSIARLGGVALVLTMVAAFDSVVNAFADHGLLMAGALLLISLVCRFLVSDGYRDAAPAARTEPCRQAVC